MKSLFSIFFLAVSICTLPAFAQSGEKLLEKMHGKYAAHWYRTLRFTQDTEVYRNDSVIKRDVWYETARFPYELRIDVGAVNSGNTTLYKKDSTYRIRNNKLQAVTPDTNPFIFFLGGMYMLPLDSVKAQLAKNGYDLSLGGEAMWQGNKVKILGAANENDSTKNQVWVDAEHLYIVRVRLKMGNAFFDVQLSDHVKIGKAWCEMRVKFFREGKLLQTERYRDVVADATVADGDFDVERWR